MSHKGESHSPQVKIDQSKHVSSAEPTKQAVTPPVAVSKTATQPITTVAPSTATQAPAQASQPIRATTASYSCHNYASMFEQYSWNADVAMAICQAESSGNPNPPLNGGINYDGVSDYGLMQLHGIDIVDPAANIAYAYYHKYLTQGWGAWYTYTSGKYTKYL